MNRSRIALPAVAMLAATALAGVSMAEGRPQRNLPRLQLTPGNVVVYRVGEGTATLSSAAAAVFLDEYSASGALVQSIALPGATAPSGANRRVVASGSADSEGQVSRSADGRYVVFTGYDAAPEATSISGSASTAVPRVVGRIDADGAFDTSTGLVDAFSGSNIRSGASDDGSRFWAAGGSSGVRLVSLGASSSVPVGPTPANGRQLHVFAGQLYASTSAGSNRNIYRVGSGLPTATTTSMPLLSATPPGANGFFMADLDATPGLDTLYVADEGADKVAKYALVSGVWTATGDIAAGDVRGLAGSVAGSSVTLFATTGGAGGTGSGKLWIITDPSGYNATPTVGATEIATAGPNTNFRGVALAPLAQSDTSTPTDTATPTATDTATATNTASATVAPSATDTSTAITPSATATAPPATPTATDPPTATDAPTVTVTAVASDTPTAIPPTDTATAQPATSTDTPTEVPTLTPPPTATATTPATDAATVTATAMATATPRPLDLPIQLLRFEATRVGRRVWLRWETASEVKTAGYRLWREQADGGMQAVGPPLIAARGGELGGASYRYTDWTAPRPATRYWLEDVGTGGGSTRHGPAWAPAAHSRSMPLPRPLPTDTALFVTPDSDDLGALTALYHADAEVVR